MLELWAAIDLLSGEVVTLKQGKEEMKTTWEEKPVDVAARWENEGADGLHIIDLDAAFGKGSNRRDDSVDCEEGEDPRRGRGRSEVARGCRCLAAIRSR